jgi:hypothetical protein
MRLTVPNVLAINESIKGNPIEQMAVRSAQQEGNLITYTAPRLTGLVFQPTASDERVLIIPPKSRQVPASYDRILGATLDSSAPQADLTAGVWLKHPKRGRAGAVDHPQVIQEVLRSWRGAFSYV